VVADGLREDLTVDNNSEQAHKLRLELHVGADFADLFEVKENRPKQGAFRVGPGERRLTFTYRRRGFRRRTTVTTDQPCHVWQGGITFELELAPHGRWQGRLQVACDGGDAGYPPPERRGEADGLQPDMSMSLQQWLERAPTLHTSHDPLRHTYHQSLVDLAALRFRPSDRLRWSLPAAGLPWFMTLFGRDSLITGYQALPFHPELAQTALSALAELQATDHDELRDADPGKIVHELRRGELAALGETPSPYYGTADATPLFLILLDEYERWSGDRDLVGQLEPAARAALAWIEGPGDPDGDGYLKYQTCSPKGFATSVGRTPGTRSGSPTGASPSRRSPPASCRTTPTTPAAEWPAWPGWSGTTRRWPTGWTATPRRSRSASTTTSGAPSAATHMLALDKDKRQVDAMTSNVGQLLWSGIVDQDRAAGVVDRLMAPDMSSGWGIRTMSSKDAAYNPIEYHNGTVWPHDTALIAEGLRRYGFRAQASTLAFDLLQAAAAFGHRLPEVFAGFDRTEARLPVEYPTVCQPQAWAAGTPLLAIRTPARPGRGPTDACGRTLTCPRASPGWPWTGSRYRAATRPRGSGPDTDPQNERTPP
jgi:glycogen debranching enzyme